MGPLSCCAKAALIIVNIIFMILSLTLLGAGAAIFIVGGMAQEYIDTFLEEIPDLLTSLPFTMTGAGDEAGEIFNIVEMLRPMAIGLICIGIILFILSILGCCGACCSVKLMLIPYAVILGIMVLVEIIIFAMVYTGKMNGPIRGQLMDRLVNYHGIAYLDADSIIWTLIMITMKCCGLDSSADFAEATDWAKTMTMEIEGHDITVVMETPVGCCMMDGDFPSMVPVDNNCTFAPISHELPGGNNYMNKGCWNEIVAKVATYGTEIMMGGIIFILVQVGLIALAVLVVVDPGGVKVTP